MKHTTSRHLTPENPMSLVLAFWISPAPGRRRLTDEADRFALSRFRAATDEAVVVDERSALTPSQAVENRLVALLREASLPVSHLQIAGPHLPRPTRRLSPPACLEGRRPRRFALSSPIRTHSPCTVLSRGAPARVLY